MSDSVVLRKVYALNSNTGLFLSTNQLLLTDGKGGTSWFPLISSLTSVGGPIIGDLPSTFSTISSQIYIQGNAIANLEAIVGTLEQSSIGPLIISTTAGLGNAGYISSSQLLSTVDGLGNTYLSTPSLFSTVTGLGTAGYISSLSLQSTLQSTTAGLGTADYISSATMNATLISSLNGLGGAPYRYISSPSLQSTLQSTTRGLGTIYLSSGGLVSTVEGLGTCFTTTEGYISTGQLVSTTTNLLNRPVYFDTASNVIVNVASSIVFNNAENVFFRSTFTTSSLRLMGTMGTEFYATVSNGTDLIFSTATFNLSTVSSFITPNSKITIEYSPTLLFSKLSLSAAAPAMLPLSTFLQNDTTLIGPLATNFVFSYLQQPVNFNGNPHYLSTFFQQPIKIEVPVGSFTGIMNKNFTFIHMLPNGKTNNALADSNVTAFFSSNGFSANISVFNTA